MSTDPAILRARLEQAETALHQLATGSKAEEARDGSGRLVRYTPADQGKLRVYIAELKAQLGMGGRGRALRPVF